MDAVIQKKYTGYTWQYRFHLGGFEERCLFGTEEEQAKQDERESGWATIAAPDVPEWAKNYLETGATRPHNEDIGRESWAQQCACLGEDANHE